MLSKQTDCAFSKLMSNMSTVPFFGTSFSFYAPLMIAIVCSITLYNVYPRLLSILGIDHEDAIYLVDDEESLESQMNEGILLLKRRRYKDSDDDMERRRNGDNTTVVVGGTSAGNDSESTDNESRKHWWYNVV